MPEKKLKFPNPRHYSAWNPVALCAARRVLHFHNEAKDGVVCA